MDRGAPVKITVKRGDTRLRRLIKNIKLFNIRINRLLRANMRTTQSIVLSLVLFTSTIIGISVAQGLTVTVPSTAPLISNLASGQTTQLTGFSVTPDATGDTLLVSIALSGAASGDRLRLCATSGCTPTNLTASFGFTSGSNTFNSFTQISFTGTAVNINSALANNFLFVASGAAPTGTPNVRLSATVNIAGVAFFSDNNHFYKVGHFMSTAGNSLANNNDDGRFCENAGTNATDYISSYSSIQSLTRIAIGQSNCNWNEANRLARASTLRGQSGYLTNITSSSENTFVQNNISGARNAWMGGSDGDCAGNQSSSAYSAAGFDYMSNTNLPTSCTGGTEGLWHWYDGPEAGQIFWRYKGGQAGVTTISNHSQWLTFRNSYETTGYNTGSEDSNGSATTNHDSVRYSNWSWALSGAHEPNNSSSGFGAGGATQGEDNLVFNWGGPNGLWNDLHGQEPSVPYYGYIIEYGDGTETGGFTGVEIANRTLQYSQSISGFTGASSSYSTQNVSISAGSSVISGTNVATALSVTYQSSDTATCTVGAVSSGNLAITLLQQGICTITASAGASGIYLAATDVTQSFTSQFGNANSGLITSCSGIGQLTNGGFENDSTGWSTTATDGGFEIWSRSHTADPTGSHNTTSPSDFFAYSGTKVAELQANNSGGANQGLYQDIATVPGMVIRYNFFHHNRIYNGGGPQEAGVRIGSAADFSTIPAAPGGWGQIRTGSQTWQAWASSTWGTSGGSVVSTNTQQTWRGLGSTTYVVPAGQTTTRFLFVSLQSPANGWGNLLDGIEFSPTAACPDTTFIRVNRAAVNFDPTANDLAPSGTNTVSVVSVSGTGSATASGSNLQLSSTSPGTFSVRYRLTNSFGDTSEGISTVTVLPEVATNAPTDIPLDPRALNVDLPQFQFTGPDNALICVNESDASGNILASPNLNLDVSTKESSQSSGSGSSTVTGDRTTTLTISHSLSNVASTINSSGGLRVYWSSNNWSSAKYLRLRTVPIESSSASAQCSDALSASARTIRLFPMGLDQVFRIAEVKQNSHSN